MESYRCSRIRTCDNLKKGKMARTRNVLPDRFCTAFYGFSFLGGISVKVPIFSLSGVNMGLRGLEAGGVLGVASLCPSGLPPFSPSGTEEVSEIGSSEWSLAFARQVSIEAFSFCMFSPTFVPSHLNQCIYHGPARQAGTSKIGNRG